MSLINSRARSSKLHKDLRRFSFESFSYSWREQRNVKRCNLHVHIQLGMIFQTDTGILSVVQNCRITFTPEQHAHQHTGRNGSIDQCFQCDRIIVHEKTESSLRYVHTSH